MDVSYVRGAPVGSGEGMLAVGTGTGDLCLVDAETALVPWEVQSDLHSSDSALRSVAMSLPFCRTRASSSKSPGNQET